MQLETLLEKLDGVKKSGGSYLAKCPAHDDKRASLSIKKGEKCILLKCFAGCAPENICSAIDLKISQLFFNGHAESNAKTRRRIVKEYAYTDEEGALLYHNLRYEPKAFMQRRADYKPKDWKLGNTRRVFYRLPELLQWIEAGKGVFYCEGEKDVDNLVAAGLKATTHAGGAEGRLPSCKVFKGARVCLLPDNDPAGRKMVAKVGAQLAGIAAAVRVLDLPGLGPKGDVSDWLEAGGTARDLIDLAKAAPLWEPPDLRKPEAEKRAGHFLPLGHNHGRYFFLGSRSQQVSSFTAAGLGQSSNLLELAPLQYWEMNYIGNKGTDWRAAANDLIEQCFAAGLFSAFDIRGRGAWWDNGHTVLHQGDALIQDGKRVELLEGGTKYVYEAAERLDIPHQAPLSAETGAKLVDLMKRLCWDSPVAAQLMAGWIALAPICGACQWRPHIWVTGPSGCGKSWVVNEIIAKLLGPLALQVQSSTTEAGLRQLLGHDARPILFDEAEGEDVRAQLNIQRVLELARQASSEGGAQIIKGSATGAAQTYSIRSAFCMSSIGVGVKRRADETRVTVLSLRKPPGGDDGADAFKSLQGAAEAVCTAEYSAGLVARACKMAPVIRANAETFAVAVSRALESRRTGDQLGALLAGYWSLWSDGTITLGKAREYVEELELESILPADDGEDEKRCLTYLLERRVRVELRSKQGVERSLGELVELAAEDKADAEITYEVATGTLGRHGIRLGDAGLMIANRHSTLEEHYSGTPFGNWRLFLMRIPGCTAGERSYRFGGTTVSRVTAVPWSVLEDEGETESETPSKEDEIPWL
jgi:putative DNA primase/helicase